MQKISVERLAKLIHEYVKNSAGDADKFKEYLLKLNLQLTRYFLQSLCQMVTVDRYSREADEYIWLANALYEIRRAIVKIDTTKELNETKLQELADRIINAALGYSSRVYYISTLMAPLFANKDTIHSPYSIFRSVITRNPTFDQLYPGTNSLSKWISCSRFRRKFFRATCDELIGKYIEEVEPGNKFYLLGTAEYGYFHISFSRQTYLNTVKLAKNFRKLIHDDGQLKMRLMAIIVYTLLQMPNVELSLQSSTIFTKKSTSCICAKLKVDRIKGLNSIIALLLLALKFGPQSLYSILPITSRHQKYYNFEPTDYWSIGFHITENVTVYQYPETAAEIILPRLYEKLNPTFAKEGLCAEGG